MIEIIVELVFEIVGTLVIEWGFKKILDPLISRFGKWAAVGIYALGGLILGSIFHLIAFTIFGPMELINPYYLFGVPVLAGILMIRIDTKLVKAYSLESRPYSFACGYLLVFCFLLTRYYLD